MPIYYDPDGYPQYDPVEGPDLEFGFIHTNYQNPVFIINIKKAFEIMVLSGMSPQECVDYFQTEDHATCRLDRGNVR